MNTEEKERIAETACDLCHWPYVYRGIEILHAEKCDHCPMRKLLNGEQEEKDV